MTIGWPYLLDAVLKLIYTDHSVYQLFLELINLSDLKYVIKCGHPVVHEPYVCAKELNKNNDFNEGLK